MALQKFATSTKYTKGDYTLWRTYSGCSSYTVAVLLFFIMPNVHMI